ncbi:glycine receptor subunit alpha-2-like isoform X1 [Amphiura filiformis]|uniref:glycine receptor subunit alpha-2-like isoform X1 n=1 Tax=Amphiura filiformis TaxID=82378 RepID=UPI003B22133C
MMLFEWNLIGFFPIFHTWLAFFIGAACVQRSFQQSNNVSTALQRLMNDDGSKLRPYNGGPPVQVDLGLDVERLSDVSASTMDFSLTMYLREYWHDPRLAHNSTSHLILQGLDVDMVWSPDIFFINEKSAKVHEVTYKNKLIYILPNGSVSMSMRLSATLACHMSLEFFPMDSQTCKIEMSSYAYNTAEMTLNLSKEDVAIDTDMEIPSFKFLKFEVNNKIMSFSTGQIMGHFHICEIRLEFERQMQAYLLTVYIPSCLLVTIAWLSFWIDARAAPARITLGITTVLTVTTMTSGILERLPIVTYAKAIDIWLAACLLFVFLCLLEYAWANYLVVLEQSRIKKRKSLKSTKKKEAANNEDNNFDECSETIEVESCTERHLTALRLDKMSRIFFPVIFALFNLIYWPVYLYKGDVILLSKFGSK